MKIDLHVHSKFSDQGSEWILRKIGCSESYSEPLQIYRIAIQRGMNRVTIADHNSILGCLEIAHLPNTFISEEVTTYFPDHLGEVHVLTLNIDEEKHRRIQKLRRNIFDLVGYLNEEGIPHVLAHPLYGLGDPLPYDIFEQFLLLFRNFELNGARAEEQNQTLKAILSSLRPEDIERIAERHGIRARGPEPWLKNLTGGSDDHSLLYVACHYTEVPGAQSLEDFFQGLENGAARVGGGASRPEDLAHSVYSIAYQFYRDRLGLRQTGRPGAFLRFLDQSLLLGTKGRKPFLSRFARFWPRRGVGSLKDLAFHAGWGLLFQREVLKVLREDPQLERILKSGTEDPGDCRNRWFTFAKAVSNRVLVQLGGRILQYADALTCGFLPLLTSIGFAGTLVLLAGPYIGAFAHFAGNRQSSRQVLARLFPSLPGNGGEKTGSSIGCFYDTLEGDFGPLFSVREQLPGRSMADLRLTEITCHDQGIVTGHEVKIFRPISRFGFPVDPASHFPVPPFLDVLKYCYDDNFNRIHSFTPGPMGLTALAVSRILQLPIRATIHHGLLHFARRFFADPSEEGRFWKYISWYYNRMDEVNVPSH